MPYSAISKDPSARLDFTFNWKPFLGTDTIATSTFPSFPAGITNDDVDVTADKVVLWLTGGSDGRGYSITNRITTVGGRTDDWVLVVYVEESQQLPTRPPWVGVRDALEYVPQAKGNPSPNVDVDLRRAAQWVEDWAPRVWPTTYTLESGITNSQDTIPVPAVQDWQYEGVLRIENEVISYFGKETELGISTGVGNLTKAYRGFWSSVPAVHSAGATVEDFDYNVRAHDTVLAVFEWLWKTRGYKPSRSGVIGSESYDASLDTIKGLVREGMGRYYTGGGRLTPAQIPTALPRKPSHRLGSAWSPLS